MKRSLPALVLGAAVVPGLAGAGYYYEARTTSDGPGPSGMVRGWVDGPNARVEFVEGNPGGPLFAMGSYFVTSNGGQTLHVVNPSERTILEMDVEQLMQMAGGMMNIASGLVRVEFDDFTSDKLAEEPGGEILGYSTTRHHLKTGYSMRMRVLGRGQESRNDTEQEIWCTDEIAAEGFDAWLRPDNVRTGNADIDRVIEQQYAGLDCVPLRSRTVTTTRDDNGTTTVSMSTEMTVLREEAVPAATFELPAGYERISLGGALAGALDGGLGTTPPEDAQPAEASAEEERRRPRLRDFIPLGR